jgi:hypothetical protein
MRPTGRPFDQPRTSANPLSARLIAISGVTGINDPHGGETWHLRQLWQFAKNRGYSVKLEDDRLWLTPSEQGSAASGRSFPDTRAGIQAARAWLNAPTEVVKLHDTAVNSAVNSAGHATGDSVPVRVASGVGRVFGWIIGFAVASTVVGGVVSWWIDNHYSSDWDSAFLSSCESKGGAAANYCGCALEQVHERYSPKEAQQVLVSGSSALSSIANYCIGQ